MRARQLAVKARALAIALAVMASPALAHAGHGQADEVSANDLAIGALMVLLLAAFAVGWTRMKRRWDGSPQVARSRAALFIAGMIALAAVLLGPLDELADHYFSAHMAQHLVLLVIAPPMLAASQAHLVLLQAFPLGLRRTLGRTVAAIPGLRFAAHQSSTIWFVCLSSVAVLWFWHLPQVYDWARRNEAVHDGEHLLFLLTELVFWRVILFRREAELSRAAAALILVAMSVQGGLLAALITLAGKPMYQNYGVGASALSDQALGGVMMWVIAGLVYLGAFSLLFARALTRTPRGRRDRPTNELHAPSDLEHEYAELPLVPLDVGGGAAERLDLRAVTDDDRAPAQIESILRHRLQHA
jgi:cytochrome c oxidase assembly factor CtaG